MAIIACIDMLVVKRNPAKKWKKESTQGAGAILKEKGPRLYLKTQIQKVYSAESWANEFERFGGTHHKNSQDDLERKTNPGKKRAISREYPKRWPSWAKSLRAQVWAKNTCGNLTTRRVTPAKQHGIWREIFISSRPRTKRRSFLLWIKALVVSKNTGELMSVVDSGAPCTCWARRI